MIQELASIWLKFPTLAPELKKIQNQLPSLVHLNDFSEINQAIASQLSKGKLVRPALTLLAAQFESAPSNQTTNDLAAIVELLHLSTLIHDDIIDHSDIRRGLPSVAHQFGSDTAVYAGDYLFVRVFQLLSRFESKDLDNRALSVMQALLLGELSQKQHKFQLSMTLDDYFEQIKGKTASLFAFSAYLGAYSTDASQKTKELAEQLGLQLGLLFQLIDDQLDYFDSNQLNKAAHQDVKNGIYTAPVILALNHPVLREKMLKTIAGDQSSLLSTADNEVIKSDLKDLIYTEFQRALQLLESIPNQAIQKPLRQLLDVIVKRSY